MRHKKLTSPNQQMLLMNVVTYASVMKNITLGSPPQPQGPRGAPLRRPRDQNKKWPNKKSCQVHFSDEKITTTTPRIDPQRNPGERGQAFASIPNFDLLVIMYLNTVRERK